MAEVSLPHSSNSLSPPPVVFRPENRTHSSIFSSLSAVDFDLSSSDLEPDACDFDSPTTDDDDFHYDVNDVDDDQVSFVTNLFFHSSENDPDSDSLFGAGLGSGGNEGFSDSAEPNSELGLGLNVGPLSQSVEETGPLERPPLIGVEPDSDSGNGSLCDIDNVNDGFGVVNDFDRPPFCWDYLGFNNRANNAENFELEARDYSCQNHESDIELSSIVTDDDVDSDDYRVDLSFSQCQEMYDDDDDVHEIETPIELDTDLEEREVQEESNLFDTHQEREEQEIMIQLDTDEVGEYGALEVLQELEWEILLALDNFRREVHNMFTREAYWLDFNEDVYETILREMEDQMNEWRGSLPTAQSFIENLPTVHLSLKNLEENDVCAICKDDISGEGNKTVNQLPCLHCYHGDCILPWLKMHNTCPLCRNELPTDDSDYEHWKTEGSVEQ